MGDYASAEGQPYLAEQEKLREFSMPGEHKKALGRAGLDVVQRMRPDSIYLHLTKEGATLRGQLESFEVTGFDPSSSALDVLMGAIETVLSEGIALVTSEGSVDVYMDENTQEIWGPAVGLAQGRYGTGPQPKRRSPRSIPSWF